MLYRGKLITFGTVCELQKASICVNNSLGLSQKLLDNLKYFIVFYRYIYFVSIVIAVIIILNGVEKFI